MLCIRASRCQCKMLLIDKLYSPLPMAWRFTAVLLSASITPDPWEHTLTTGKRLRVTLALSQISSCVSPQMSSRQLQRVDGTRSRMTRWRLTRPPSWTLAVIALASAPTRLPFSCSHHPHNTAHWQLVPHRHPCASCCSSEPCRHTHESEAPRGTGGVERPKPRQQQPGGP